MKYLGMIFTAIITLALLSPASAHTHYRHHAYRHHHHVPGIVVGLAVGFKHMLDSADQQQRFPDLFQIQPQGFPPQPPPVRFRERSYDGGSVVAHPAGCPSRAFCGCGVSVRVFGHSVRGLWPAAAWYVFPRASAAPGRVAIFGRHHVAYIESVDGDGTATLYDPNSGGHLTRVHRMSIRGATIVDPSGRYARR